MIPGNLPVGNLIPFCEKAAGFLRKTVCQGRYNLLKIGTPGDAALKPGFCS